MFVLEKEQKICKIGNITVGGQPGENPPLLIGSMFHDRDSILESRAERKFDRVKAAELIKRQDELSQKTGLPALVDLVAVKADEMKGYIEFYMGITDAPFAIDMWNAGPRMEVARYISSLGIQDKVLYNSITHFDPNVKESAQELKELGFKHVVIQTYEKQAQMPEDYAASLRKMLNIIGPSTFESVLVDTASVNLPVTALSCIAGQLIKEEFGLPVGCCPTTGISTWKEAIEQWGVEGVKAIDVAEHALASLMWNDYLFYGPIARAARTFPSIATTEVIRAVCRTYETKELPTAKNHPLYLLFNDFAEQFKSVLELKKVKSVQ